MVSASVRAMHCQTDEQTQLTLHICYLVCQLLGLSCIPSTAKRSKTNKQKGTYCSRTEWDILSTGQHLNVLPAESAHVQTHFIKTVSFIKLYCLTASLLALCKPAVQTPCFMFFLSVVMDCLNKLTIRYFAIGFFSLWRVSPFRQLSCKARIAVRFVASMYGGNIMVILNGKPLD